MGPTTGSPYARALGARMPQLHPVLQQYFATIPAGSVGIGEGVFDCFGTKRAWLRPVLALLKRGHVIVPGMHRQVPFRIENRTVAGSQTAVRTLELNSGTWSMLDAVALGRHGGVVDVLGRPSMVEAGFAIEVSEGALNMTSHSVALRLGRLRVPLPGIIRPVVRLSERFDDVLERQRIELTLDMPLLGRIYEYRGEFTYAIVSAE